MKKVTPDGSAIKALRLALEKLSTQKEMAHRVGVSVRMLRKIENESVAIQQSILSRFALALGVSRDQLIKDNPVTPAYEPGRKHVFEIPDFDDVLRKSLQRDEPKLVPLYDFDYARATKDPAKLYDDAHAADDIQCIIQADLTDETSQYSQELIETLTQLTRPQRFRHANQATPEAAAEQKKLRELIVLLRGNDIWIYTAIVHRRLPERDTLPPAGEETTLQWRLMLVLAPPAEYGEDSIRIPVDNGQPMVLPRWRDLFGQSASQ